MEGLEHLEQLGLGKLYAAAGKGRVQLLKGRKNTHVSFRFFQILEFSEDLLMGPSCLVKGIVPTMTLQIPD